MTVKSGEDPGLVSTWDLPRPGGAQSPVLCACSLSEHMGKAYRTWARRACSQLVSGPV